MFWGVCSFVIWNLDLICIVCFISYSSMLNQRKWLKPYDDAIEEARANVSSGIAKDDWNDLVDWQTNEDYMVPLHIIILY